MIVEKVLMNFKISYCYSLDEQTQSDNQFCNSQELFQILVYFMTLCHGWPCTTYLQHSNWWWWLYCYVLFSSHWFDNWALNCHLPVVNLPRLNFEQSSMIHYSEDHHSLFFYLALWRLVFWLMISSILLILRSKVFLHLSLILFILWLC